MTTKFLSGAALLLSLSAFALPASAQSYVCFDTSEGDICMDLLPEAAPNTVNNFLNYVNRGALDETLVHRSVPGFVIQGGGYSFRETSFLQPVPADPAVISEVLRSNLRGSVAMARLTGNPTSATSQWFINLVDNPTLDTFDGGYTVFANVVAGMHVVDRIAAYRVNNFSNQLGAVFTEVPVDVSATATEVDLTDFVVVHRAYATNVLPYHCSAAGIGDTLTEFCGTTLTLPVLVNGTLYEATLRHLADRSGLVFGVDRSSLKPLVDNGIGRAVFSNNQLVIPSIRIGAGVVENVTLDLTNQAALEFTVRTFSRR